MANIKISEIVGAFLDQNNLGAAEYAKCYAIAIRGWRELNWDIVGVNKQIRLCVECDNTVSLPDDFISETKVEMDNGCGGSVALTRSNHLNTESISSDLESGLSNVRGHDSGSLYGYPSECSEGLGSYQNSGYFYIDKGSNQILLNSDYCGADVILTYLSYTDVKGDYTINELCQSALLWWIRWEYSLTGTRYGLGEKSYNEQKYYNEKRKAKRRIKRWMTQDLNQLARMSVKGGIKS